MNTSKSYHARIRRLFAAFKRHIYERVYDFYIHMCTLRYTIYIMRECVLHTACEPPPSPPCLNVSSIIRVLQVMFALHRRRTLENATE